MSEITGGELLLKSLHAEGVQYINAITDGTYMLFLEALERLGEELGIKLIVPRHEAAAAHSCDAYSRVTGKPAVVMACAGPGAANLISGLMCAEAEGSPVIAITTRRRSDISDNYRHMGATQVANHVDAFKSIVKWSGQIDHWKRIPDMVRYAFRVSTTGRPGPTHLIIPEDVMKERKEETSIQLWKPENHRLTEPLRAPANSIQEAAKILTKADFVNIHCGNGVERSMAAAEVKSLAEYLGAAVTMTGRARGTLPDKHELAFHQLCMSRVVANVQADVVLIVGSRLGEFSMWGMPPLWGEPGKQQTIQIDIEPANVGLNRPVDVSLVGDAKATLAGLLEEIKKIVAQKATHEKVNELNVIQDEWQQELDQALADMNRTPMLTGQIVKICNDFFDENAIFVMDGGNTTLWSINYHVARKPYSTLHSTYFGHLGTGLPYAIGAKLAFPQRQVYCVSGDSAFGFNLQELETAVRNNLPVIVIVAVDGAFGMEKSSQRFNWGRKAPWFQHDHAPVRYDQIGIAMGCFGEYVNCASDLRDAMGRAVTSGKPSVIHAEVDSDANIDPPGIDIYFSARAGQI